MENINYKELDRKAILDYLADKEEVEVEKLMEESGANRLRVYPLLFELTQEGLIRITHNTELGAPERVELCKG